MYGNLKNKNGNTCIFINFAMTINKGAMECPLLVENSMTVFCNIINVILIIDFKTEDSHKCVTIRLKRKVEM